MRILDRYIIRDYLITLLLTVFIFSFVMCVGSLVKAIDLMSRGISGGIILKIFLLNFPYILQFTIPMSALTTVLLLFTRLSMDGEITAMKACGISLWQIISPVVMCSILLSLFCMMLTNSLSPAARHAQRTIQSSFSDEDPMSLLEEGRFVRDFPNLMIRVGKKQDRRLSDVDIYEIDPRRNRVKMHVRARAGLMRMDPTNNVLHVDLYDMRADWPAPDPTDISRARTLTAAHYPYEIDMSKLTKAGPYKKKIKDYTFGELSHAIRNVADLYPKLPAAELVRQRMGFLVEANNRMALSMACFAYTLLGVPLGLRSRRRESSVGVLISLGIMFVFYFFMILAKNMVDVPQFRPDLLVWLPVIAGELAGMYLITKSN